MKAFVTEQNGVRQISIDGKLYPPYSFRSFRPEERNISEFYGAGVRLMSILMTGIECTLQVPYSLYGEIWTGKGQYDFAAIDRQMELFLRCAPDAYFNIMLQLDTRDWYLKEHPEFSNTFHNLIEMAGCREWREDVCEYLRDVIGYLEEKYGDRIFSYSMFCGGSTEWYTNSQCAWCEDGKIRKFPLKQEAFQIPSPAPGVSGSSTPPGRTAEGTLCPSGKKDPALTPRALRSYPLLKRISVIPGLHRRAI